MERAGGMEGWSKGEELKVWVILQTKWSKSFISSVCVCVHVCVCTLGSMQLPVLHACFCVHTVHPHVCRISILSPLSVCICVCFSLPVCVRVCVCSI